MTTNPDTLFRPLTIATAPQASRPALEQIQKSLGFIPNLMATFANNPAVLQGYLALDAAYEKGSFTPRERQIILLAASVENSCDYCTAAHSTIAKGALYTPLEVITAIRKGLPVPDGKLDALVKLVKELVRERGHAKNETIQRFLAAGYKKEQVMELLLGVALKTISNYLDHISPTSIDPAGKLARHAAFRVGEQITHSVSRGEIVNSIVKFLSKLTILKRDLPARDSFGGAKESE